jgi:hypothetical protein
MGVNKQNYIAMGKGGKPFPLQKVTYFGKISTNLLRPVAKVPIAMTWVKVKDVAT